MSIARAKQRNADFAIDPEGFDARAINSLVDSAARRCWRSVPGMGV